MLFQRLVTRILFSLFIGSFLASITVFVVPDLTLTWILVIIWSGAITTFLLVSRYAKKKMAQQQAEIEKLLNQKGGNKKIKKRK